jgi:hypothetical protein
MAGRREATGCLEGVQPVREGQGGPAQSARKRYWEDPTVRFKKMQYNTLYHAREQLERAIQRAELPV